jgi:hypothetical protein
MRGYRGHSAASLGANAARDLVLHHTRGIAGLFFASLTGSAPADDISDITRARDGEQSRKRAMRQSHVTRSLDMS